MPPELSSTHRSRTPTAPDAPARPESFAILRPEKQPPDPRRPLPHQRAARERLDAHHEEARTTGAFEGLLVMPTGAGKTYTAADWLMKTIVNDGGRVLWLAHRDELLEQAALAFHRASGSADRRDRVAVRIVSGGHCRAAEIGPEDDVVVASVASLARHPEALGGLLAGPRLFTAVDEYHHAVAPSYRAVLDPLRSRTPRAILGLTATPTRTVARERPLLAELVGGRVIYEVEPADLVERGVLARPTFVRVRTGAVADGGLTAEDRNYLRRYGDYSPDWLDRIARIEGRNAAIVDHYLKHRARYGRTLIFAANVAHAVLLADRLRAIGVQADYLACRRRDGQDNRKVLDRFRTAGGGLEVLVNVGLLTEGADLPAVQTVLLARPTLSEILLQQMIGRALRGPAVGGTETAFVVALLDRWHWGPACRAALERVREQIAPVAAPRPGRGRGRAGGVLPPQAAIEVVGPEVRALIPARPTESSESVAESWLVVGGGEWQPSRRAIAVYTHQRGGYEAACAYLEQLPAGELAAADAKALAARFFATSAGPPPSTRDLGLLLDHYRAGGAPPEGFGPEGCLACDPRTVARLIAEGDLGERARIELLAGRYTRLAEAFYPTPGEYRAAVDEALYALEHPGEAAWANPARPVYEGPASP